jgi:lipoate-protein ligase B
MRSGLLVRSELVGYREAWGTQRRLAAARAAGEIPDVLWLLEHPPTYTYGRHGKREDLFLDDEALAAAGAEVVATDRGGQMTWHGPGQSVLYAICDLRPARRVRGFVDALVGAMADAAGLDGAGAGADATGLYIEGRKLGSVGIRVSGGVTMHGLALNRDPDPRWFNAMTACGAPDVATTSIVAEGGDGDRDRVDDALAQGAAARLGLEVDRVPIDRLSPQTIASPPGAPT